MRSYAALSDHDFERLVADLLHADEGVRFEVFPRGPDGGIDLRRWRRETGEPDVVQCKHYLDSTWSHLLAAAKAEKEKVSKLDPAPASYRFVTSQRLTIKRKQALANALRPWIRSVDDVIGADDLEGYLSRHPEVERQHVKLWLTGGTQLEALLNAGIYTRSRQLLAETQLALPRYVETHAFAAARERLRNERALIISGPPGMGKTTLARMLMADAVMDGYELIEISADPEEGNQVLKADQPQVFYFDDFLGSSFLTERLGKNEDKRLTGFIRRVAASKTSLLVMTTREYILQQAAQEYEIFERERLDARRFVLELPEYSRFDRALIFYNHVWHSGQLDGHAREALAQPEGYARIIDHPNYNPRLIEYITGMSSRQLSEEDNSDYVFFALAVLDDPKLIWEHAFERQLDEPQKGVLIALSSMPGAVTVEDLEAAFRTYSAVAGIPSSGAAFRDALSVLEDSFVRSYKEAGRIFIEPANPSIRDFMGGWLADFPHEGEIAIRGTCFFEQLWWLDQAIVEVTAGDNRVRLGASFAEAVTRLWGSQNPAWREVYYQGSDEPQTSRSPASPEERLVDVLAWIEANPAYGDVLELWLPERLNEVASRWREEHIADAGLPVSLVGALHRAGRLTQEVLEAAKFRTVENLTYTYGWDQLMSLRRIEPAVFSLEEWAALQDRCARWAADEFQSNYADYEDTEQLSDVSRVAKAMGVDIDEDQYDSAWDYVHERSSAREEQAMDSVSDNDRAEQPALEIDRSDEISALFARLRGN